MKAIFSTLLLVCLFFTGCREDAPAETETTPSATTPSATTAPTAVSGQPNGGQAPGDLGDGGGNFVPAGYELVWSDEFNYTGLPDTTKWGYQTGGYGWTAKEQQNYLKADPDNVGVANGALRITALEEQIGRNSHTSTRLVSKGKAEFTRGYFEVRAQVPSGPGIRSSFWMVGDTVSTIGWPDAGEIDLFEHYGKFPTVMNANVQNFDNYWSKGNQLGAMKIVKGCETDFHTYGLEWTETDLKFSVDGEVYWTFTQPPGRSWKGFPFRWPFYMAATVAVGGVRGPQSKPESASFPANMYLDYVRVYQK